MAAATKSRPKPSVNGNHRRTLPVQPVTQAATVQTSAPVDPGRYHPGIPIDKILPSPTNPRKHFDPDKLAELAQSLRNVGLIEPIIVRPYQAYVVRKKQPTLCSILGHGDPEPDAWEIVDRAAEWKAKKAGKPLADAVVSEWHNEDDARHDCRESNRIHAEQKGHVAFELVAGERRWRAHKLAELPTIAAIVRELDDEQALEIQIIENLQSEDVDPVDEAEGFQALVTHHGYTAKSVGEKVGKSKAYVHSALKMLAAPAKALELVRQGEIAAGVAELFGRIPAEKVREQAFKDCLKRYGAPSVRDAKFYIQNECMIELKDAPFDREDASLTEAGACGPCPFRTGNAPDDFPDSRADICTNPGCYRKKVDANGKKRVEAAKAEGRKVLDGPADKIFSQYGSGPARLHYNLGYVDLGDKCHDAKKNGTWEKLLGKDAKEHIAVAVDQKGEAHELVPKHVAARILKAKGLAFEKNGGHKAPKRTAEEILEAKIDEQMQVAIPEAAAAAAAKRPVAEILDPVVRLLLLGPFEDDLFDILNVGVRGVDAARADPAERVKSLNAAELFAELVKVAIYVGGLRYGTRNQGTSEGVFEILKLLGVDEKTVRKQVLFRLSKEPAEKPSGKNGKAAKR